MSWNPSEPQGRPFNSLSQAIQELPWQYIKAVTRPSIQMFVEEKAKAIWSIILLQGLFIVLIDIIQATLDGLYQSRNSLASYGTTPPIISFLFSTAHFPSPLMNSLACFIIIILPIASIGVQYLLAKAFRGRGTLKQQVYTQLLFQLPITVVTDLLGLLLGVIAVALGHSLSLKNFDNIAELLFF